MVHDAPSMVDRLHGASRRQALNRDKYVRLFVRGKLVMTDAEFERATNRDFLRKAHGDCLVFGLGIGLILDPLLKRCNSVTVVEKELDVIAIVGPSFPTCKVFCGDVWKWRPERGRRFDTIYFDIWPHFNEYTDREADRLHKRFKRYLRNEGYMESWCQTARRMYRPW